MRNNYLGWLKGEDDFWRSAGAINFGGSGVSRHAIPKLQRQLEEAAAQVAVENLDAPMSWGLPAIKTGISRLIGGVAPDRICPVAGASQAIFLALQAVRHLLRRLQRPVALIESPTYSPLREVAAYLGFELRSFRRGRENRLQPAPALPSVSNDPKRVKGLIETAHALLAGLDPSDEMAFALAHHKLASVHLNDQNGLKYDQDKNFGAANLRAAFNQVRVLEEAGFGRNGEFVGLDVKAMRTQKGSPVTAHLKNSREIFLHLVQKVRTLDKNIERQFIEARDYEALELYVLKHLMGV